MPGDTPTGCRWSPDEIAVRALPWGGRGYRGDLPLLMQQNTTAASRQHRNPDPEAEDCPLPQRQGRSGPAAGHVQQFRLRRHPTPRWYSRSTAASPIRPAGPATAPALSPSATVVPGGMTARALLYSPEPDTPELWLPKWPGLQPLPRSPRLTRRYSWRLPGAVHGEGRTGLHRGRSGRWISLQFPAGNGRATRQKVTNTELGFPGRPINGVAPMPGRPGACRA